jgi:molybdopterin-guanine dinucleotide biosynthesis protein A
MSVRGFVQAGGGSTRFGTDKALVQLGGKTMLQRTAELFAGVSDDVTIVAPPGKYAASPWPVLADLWPGQGPLGGILTALETVQNCAEWALIVSCDMPFLTSEFLAYLCQRTSQTSALVVVPESANGLEPLCACWNSRALSSVQATFDSGVRKVTEAMKRLPMEVLDESVWKRFDTESRLFWNMNTPADYDEARRILEAPEA